MEIVLKKDYEKLGVANDIVNVKNGYARNYLIPSGIAVPATKGNKKVVAQAKLYEEKREEKKAKVSRQLARKIEEVPCTISVKVKKDNEEIYGSVTEREISEYLTKEGFKIEKSAIKLEEPIKRIGVYTVNITIYKGVDAKLKVWVVKEEKK